MLLSFLESAAPVVTATRAHRPVRAKPPIDRPGPYRDWRDDRDWLESQAEELHIWFLFRHLRLLADPLVGPVERDDLLNGLCADSMPPEPFSFTACARADDSRIDPAVLRERILMQLRRQGFKPPLQQAA
ncbi:MAG: hypothetical protein H6974_11760 [Gammaproteobacteria bacterium]|nr:hypothetical protein [Gammaproteobacteria bacterium]